MGGKTGPEKGRSLPIGVTANSPVVVPIFGASAVR
jgi:hypothetical protein